MSSGAACSEPPEMWVHGIFVHLYVNGLYWGLYNPCERPDASFCADYYGGDKEDWDAIHDLSASNGDKAAWNQMTSKCRQAAHSNQAYQELQGNNPDGTPNPEYPNLLDVTNYIDYLIVNLWGGNWDWPWKNWWAGRDRTVNSTGFKFYCWDYENTMGNNLGRSPLDKNALENNFSSAGEPHQSLERNPEYRMLFADRVHKFFFNRAILTPESLIRRYTDLAATVEKAIVAESARWGDQHHSIPLTLEDWYDHGSNYNDGRAGRDWILNYYLPQRSDIVLQQFRNAGLYPNVDAPTFGINGAYQHGGIISADDLLSMTAPAGTIWYTLDGSDPRSSGTSQQQATVLVSEDADKRAIVADGPVGDEWKGGGDFDDSAWLPCTGSPGGGGFERISGYQDFISLDLKEQMYARNATCYVRIPFIAKFTGGSRTAPTSLTLNVRYDDGFVAYINGAEVALEYTGPITLPHSANVKARVLSGGTWSALNEAVFAVGPVAELLRVTEIMYNPIDPNEEFIELKNIGAETINLNMASFTNGIDFSFPNIELAVGEYTVVVRNRNVFEARYGTNINIAGQYSGRLNNAGERIKLEDAAFNYRRRGFFADDHRSYELP